MLYCFSHLALLQNIWWTIIYIKYITKNKHLIFCHYNHYIVFTILFVLISFHLNIHIFHFYIQFTGYFLKIMYMIVYKNKVYQQSWFSNLDTCLRHWYVSTPSLLGLSVAWTQNQRIGLRSGLNCRPAECGARTAALIVCHWDTKALTVIV